MGDMLQDVRFGMRMMIKSPVVTVVAVLSLATAIAANTAIFSLLNAFLFEPFPYEDQDELVLAIEFRQGTAPEDSPGMSVPNFRDYVAAAEGLEDAALYDLEEANLTGVDVPQQLQVAVATPNLFDVLGVAPRLGRGFRADEGVEGAGQVVVLEHDYWESALLADPDVLGSTLTLDGAVYTVIGVMPEAFDMIPANVQAMRPSDFASQQEARGTRGYTAIGRLAPGVTAEQIDARWAGVAERLAATYPESNRGWTVRARKLREWFPGPTDTQLLKVLSAVTLFGLLIACANVANLLLGRAEERQKEIAVRTALGAGRRRVLRQLLTESVLLGAAAGAVGSAMSVWLVGWTGRAMPVEIPAAFMPELDPEVLLATVAISVIAGIVFGLAPSLHAIRGDLREALGAGGRGGSASRGRKRLRNAFVVGEVAVALALLVGSGVLIQAFERLSNDDPGFEASGLLTFRIAVPENRHETDDAIVRYQEELLRAVEAVPGVSGVAIMSSLPRSRGNPGARYTIEGRPPLEESERPVAGVQVVSPSYFRTMSVPLAQGRGFEEGDRAEAPLVAVVSEAFVRREFPGQDPLGERIEINGASREIVGVVGDVLQERIAVAGRGGEAVYVPLAQGPRRNPSFAVRAVGDPADLAADVRRAVWGVAADQPIAALRPLEAHIQESLAGPRAIGIFLLAMGVIALALAAMGIYGVMAHSVTQQQREIGIRMALGANRGSVVGMVARNGLGLVLLGLLLGTPLVGVMVWATANALNVLDVGIVMGYPVGLSAALLLVACAATLIPASRASGVAPVVALKE